MLILQTLVSLLVAAAPPQRATPEEAAAFAGQMRTLVLQLIPDPLYTDDKKWNHQKKGPAGKLRNEGRWVKVRITAKDIDRSLRLTVEDMVKEKSRKTFTINLSFDAQVDLERQTWRAGLRLYSGSTRARMRVKMAMRCELLTRVEKSASWLPDMIVKLNVLSSSFGYDEVIVEHTAGVGGDAAKILGELMLGIVKQAKPSLESKMIEKANAAVVKAGNTKEVRISLADWLNGKPAKK